MTKQKRKDDNDELALKVATALAVLVVDKKFRIGEGDTVQDGFAYIVGAVEASAKHATRISILEKKLEALEAKATPPKLKAVS